MYRLVTVGVFVLFLAGHSGLLLAKPNADKGEKKMVEELKSHPQLGLQLNSVAQLKIASRKSTFHLGELITIDVAMLNMSPEPVFFQRLSDPKLSVRDIGGGPNLIQAYGVADRTTVPGSFILLTPNQFLNQSVQLLAGCDRRALEQMSGVERDRVTIFRENLFLNWGNACLRLASPGTYTINAEVNNDYVLVAPRQRKIKTAVGSLNSNSLEVTIIK